MRTCIKRVKEFMDNAIFDLSIYRYKKAEEKLASASMLLIDKLYSSSLNCSYYAMFHAVRSIFALSSLSSPNV